MAEFSHIQSIETVMAASNSTVDCDKKAATTLRLKVAGSSELLTVSCSNITVAENMADLIDGYCRLVNNSSTSIWNRKGEIKTDFINYLVNHILIY